MSETNVCKTCPNCKYEYVATDGTYNLICLKETPHKTIANHVSFQTNVDKPWWCNLESTQKPKNVFDILSKRKPPYQLKDIKVGDEFHVPPYGQQERHDIIVTGVFLDYLTYREKNEKSKTEYDYMVTTRYMYPSYSAFKLLVKKIDY